MKIKKDGLTVDYDCGCKWYEMQENKYFPLAVCPTHKKQVFTKALSRLGMKFDFDNAVKVEL